MKILHVAHRRKGGIGRQIRDLEIFGEDTWCYEEDSLNAINWEKYNVIVFYWISPEIYREISPRIKHAAKIIYFRGLVGISPYTYRMIARKEYLWGKHVKAFLLQNINFLRFRSFLQNNPFYKICNSFFTCETIKKNYKIKINDIIYPGIIFPNDEPAHNRERYILWVGRNSWYKGIDRYLKLMEKLNDWEGWIVGEIPRNKYKIPTNVRIIGHIDYERMKNIYKKAYITVITSYFDAFPLSVLESLHYGTPVLVMKDSGGPWEILQLLGEYQWGFDSIEQMANYIKNTPMQTFSNKKLLHSIFSIDKFINRLYSYAKNLYY